jgi:glucokinase
VSGPWLGLDIGASKILGAVVSDTLEVLGTCRVPSERERGPEHVLRRALAVCAELIAKSGPARGVGAGFAGLVDGAGGTVLSSIMLPGWDRFPLADRLCAGLDLPSRIDNDATAAGFGELVALGSPPHLNMILLTVGTGIGGAIVIDGKLYRGAKGLAGEFGNMTIDWRGKTCWCGSQGCLNTLASGSAISAHAALLAGESEGGTSGVLGLAGAGLAGDSAGARALREGATSLGAGIANLINIFNPDRVVLTGGVTMLGAPYLDLVRAEARRRALDGGHARIELSVLGYDTCAFGGACLVRAALRAEAS